MRSLVAPGPTRGYTVNLFFAPVSVCVVVLIGALVYSDGVCGRAYVLGSTVLQIIENNPSQCCVC
jgi:hypothetical protein